MIDKIKKRDGKIVSFEKDKIINAIFNAAKSVGGQDYETAKRLGEEVIGILKQKLGPGEIPTVEQVQDIVEKVLVENGHYKTAKSYILYRKQHEEIRKIKDLFSNVEVIENYLNMKDWRVKENANMTYSLQGLNFHVSSIITSQYWLNKIYPPEIKQAHLNGEFHIHDLGILGAYCVGWDLQDLLLSGFKGVRGKIESKPAKHFRSALGQIVNFFYTLQGESAGAQAFSFDGQTPIVIKRNGNIEFITLEMLFNDYKHLARELNKSEVILAENIYRRYSIDDADKRKYLDSRLPSEPILFQLDQIEVLTEQGFIPLKAISRHKIENKNDELLIIETEDGNVLRITRSHPVILSNGTIKRGNELREGDELLSTNSSVNFTGKIKLQSDFAYLIGFMIAEGCWGHQTKDYSVASQKKNTEERKKIENILKKLKIPYHENEDFNIVLGTTRMGRFIRNHLKLQDGSHRKNLPAFVFDLTNENIGDLISGIIDGDGDIDRERIVRIHSTSYTLLMQLKQILDVLGINSTVRYSAYKNAKKNWKDAYVLRFRVDEEKLPIFRHSIKLQNIKTKVKESPEFSSKVVKIVEAKMNSVYVYDITTENEHFLINNIVVHNSNFDTLLAPFIRYDNLNYKQVKQAVQEFLFNINVPTRVGFQTPFTNITLDLVVPNHLKNMPVIIGGKPQSETYGDFQKEIDIFNKVFAEVMIEGDANNRVFTFPIPTYNIAKDFEFENKNYDKIFEMASKYGIPYFANFINSEMKPEDVRSMCCRLRIDNRLLQKRGGGLFGANPLTGSIGVVTINMPRLGFLSKTKEEFFEKLEKIMLLAKNSLEIKRKTLENLTEKGLYPYSKFYLRDIKKRFNQYWKNHFSTIGLIGMNECCLNFLGCTIGDKEGLKFAEEVLDFMRNKLVEFQEKTGNNYNLEATPAEGTSYRLARIDKKKFPEIIVANNEEVKKGAKPYYTNSTQLPVNFTDDIFEALKLQEGLQTKYTGGTTMHIFLGEKKPSVEAIKTLVKKICENFSLPYFTITPTFSICPVHGYIFGEHNYCPKCETNKKKTKCEVYSRIVGYLRPVDQWNEGKQEEFKQRKTFDKSLR